MAMRAKALALVFVVALALPAISYAQALGAVAGIVKDGSGAVMPGVTIEASSPALIEKVRVAVSDSSGQYRIVNLPPGKYVVTFTLEGFNTYRREELEIATNFTANIDAEMRVGAVQEAVTVTGESPIVDVQSAAQTRSVTAETFKELPSSGSWIQMAALVPAIRASNTDVGGVLGDQTGAQISAHGSRAEDGVSLLDGLRIGNMYQSSNLTNMSLSPLLFDQVDVQMSGQSGESGTNGVIMNAIPRSGGNTFHGAALANGSSPSLQSSNITDNLRARGLNGASTSLKKLYDVNGAIGGPIKRDKVWFYYTSRYFTNEYYLAGLFYPQDTSAIVRSEDLSRQAYGGTWTADNNVRLTWGISPKQKLTGWYAYQYKEDPHWLIGATLSPEAVRVTRWNTQLATIKWVYTATNRLLFEAGFAPGQSPDTIRTDLDRVGGVSIQEQGSAVGSALSLRPLTYRAPTAFDWDDKLPSQTFSLSGSYVTGSHNVKLGMEFQRGYFERNDNNDSTGGIWYRTRDYIPNQVTIQAPNEGWRSNLDHNIGIYLQDRWTLSRLTVSGGVRLDMQKESYSDFTSQPHRWLPNRNEFYPGQDVVDWKDVNPRISGAYDLFGNGRTALKASASRGVEQDSVRYATATNVASTLVTSVSRTWNDTNNNFSPDCDLLNPAANGECLVWLDPGFGSARPNTFYDPAILNGWGNRPWNWEFSAGIQHEIMPRLSANFSYHRRINGNFYVVDNEALSAADFTQFAVTVPTDARLPLSGQTIGGFYDQNALVTNRNVVKASSQFGKQYGHWDGVDLTLDTRLRNSLFLQGGISTGKTMSDNCDIVDDVPESLGGGGGAGIQPLVGTSTSAQFCHQETPFLPQYKALASYTLPLDVRVSGTFQSVPGPQINANQILLNGAPGTTLGRNFLNNQYTANLNQPGSAYGDRLNQFDFRFTKLLSVGNARRLELSADIYNAFNSDAVLTQQNAYGSTWQLPLSVIQPRFVKFAARLDF